METEKLPPPPSSKNSSPTHEFSFTISLHPPTPHSSNSLAPEFDLSPADEIFFHGQLLPLHFLSHRASNAAIETGHKLCKNAEEKQSSGKLIQASAFAASSAAATNEEELKQRIKLRPFSSFFALRNWMRGSDDSEAEKQRKKTKKKKKKNKKKQNGLGRFWKKYASLMEALLFFKAMKEKRERRKSSYSFSGDCDPREGGWRRRWRGDFSAPASLRTSPTNSGVLVAPPAFSSSNESTMEELQNAIQAAIAHCKGSVSVKENKSGH